MERTEVWVSIEPVDGSEAFGDTAQIVADTSDKQDWLKEVLAQSFQIVRRKALDSGYLDANGTKVALNVYIYEMNTAMPGLWEYTVEMTNQERKVVHRGGEVAATFYDAGWVPSNIQCPADPDIGTGFPKSML